jgi:DNA modification methylase
MEFTVSVVVPSLDAESNIAVTLQSEANWASWMLPTPKISPTGRSGVHGWLYYYAAFSAQFVKSLLTTLRLNQDSLVLDPFVGCGTTSAVAKSMGIPSIGIELNPIAYYVARAKVGWKPNAPQLNKALQSLEDRLPRVEPTRDYLKWFHRRDPVVTKTLGLGQAITERVAERGLRDFLLAALLLSLRQMAKVTCSSNPTWIRNGKRHPMSVVEPHRAFANQARTMLHDLTLFTPHRKTRAEILFGDSTKLEFDKAFNAIVTSPPYLTRIDYIVNFRMENEFLANLKLPSQIVIPDLRDEMIGTVTIPDRELAEKDPISSWGPVCVNVLERVRKHPAKASLSYYYPTIYNYFDKIYTWLQHAHAALNDDGLAFVMVQTSYFKDVEITLGDIFLEMAQNIGFHDAQKIRTELVRTRKDLHEDVLLLAK